MKTLMPTALLILLTQVPQPATNELELDFRGGKFRQALLDYYGAGAKDYIKREALGLRITIPEGEESGKAVGITLKLAVEHDFEITLAYEILQAEASTKGAGPGIRLSATAASEAKDIATIAWRSDAKNEVFATNRAFKVTGRKDKHNVKTTPAPGKSGKLRLARTGSTLVYSAAEGDQDTFKELRREEFVADPINAVRFIADRRESKGGLDLRVVSLMVRGVDLSANKSIVPETSSNAFWIVVGVIFICLVPVAGYLVWRLFRTRKTGDLI